MGDKDCKGKLHTIELDPGPYEPDQWYPDGNKNAKADNIEGLMKKLGIAKTNLCENADKCKENEKCRPHSLHANAQDEGGDKESKPEKADLSIADVKLFDANYHKFVLRVKKKCTVLVKVGCACMGKDE